VKELDALKEEFDSLDPRDRRWIFVCAAVATAALLYAILVGSVVGDILGFVLAVGTGWLIRSQWQVVTHSATRVSAREQVAIRARESSERKWPHRVLRSMQKLGTGTPVTMYESDVDVRPVGEELSECRDHHLAENERGSEAL